MSTAGTGDSLRVLILDDEAVSRMALEQCLADTPHEVHTESDPEAAAALLVEEIFDVAFVDLRLPGTSGMEFIRRARERSPWIKAVIMTAYASIESAVEAVRAGAIDYIEKPVRPGQVQVLLEKMLAIRRMERRADALRKDSQRARPLLSSDDPVMREVLELAQRVAQSEATVLLLGESGSGKGILARAMHHWSARAEEPFSTISCPSLSEELLRSELFGHERGSFTGAVKAQRGRIETTQGGTLFLDEVADLPQSIQPQLLRFIQDREYERLGSTQTRRADVRIIAATNSDLREAVRAGAFREDLYYRLDVIEIVVPPLRSRPADILPLARTCLHLFARENNRTIEDFTDSARAALRAYTWPGNVRELENAVERAVILCQGREIGPELLPAVPDVNAADSAWSSPPAMDGASVMRSLREVEKAHIRRVLEETGSVEEAAVTLGISTTTLWRRRKKYEI